MKKTTLMLTLWRRNNERTVSATCSPSLCQTRSKDNAMCRDMWAGQIPSTTCDWHFPPHPRSDPSVNTEMCDAAPRHADWQDVRTSRVGWIFLQRSGGVCPHWCTSHTKPLCNSPMWRRPRGIIMWPADHAHQWCDRYLSHCLGAWRRAVIASSTSAFCRVTKKTELPFWSSDKLKAGNVSMTGSCYEDVQCAQDKRCCLQKNNRERLVYEWSLWKLSAARL